MRGFLRRLLGLDIPPVDSVTARLDGLDEELRAFRSELVAWEARAAKLTREMSRHLKAIAEVERREAIKRGDEEPEEAEDEDIVTRTLRFGRGR